MSHNLFLPNPEFDTETCITDLGIGEALVSVLDDKGRPLAVQRTMICPPESRIGPLSEEERLERIERSPLKGRYDDAVDRESAYEILMDRAAEMKVQQEESEKQKTIENAKPRGGRRRQSTGEAFIHQIKPGPMGQVRDKRLCLKK